ncbi:MAG: hypothetical protein LBC63_03180 [Holophagales bacterium]|jgi:hypothetical protein|nr:hypothetical protein [Holophagales bacterium]
MNNTTSDTRTRTCQFYAVGQETDGKIEFLSIDEYDSQGSGRYYSDDLLVCERYNISEAKKRAKDEGRKVFLVTIEKSDGRIKIDVVVMSH